LHYPINVKINACAKAIHIAKSLKKPTAQPKLVNKYVFATAERTIETKSQLPTHAHTALRNLL
jgi:hypothetical protein